MTRWLHGFSFAAALAALLVAPLSAGQSTPAQVQVVVADAKAHLSADASSPVVTPVPIGAPLEVIGATGNFYQVRLPKDASGFDRVGYILKSQVKEMAGSKSGAASSSASASASGAASASGSSRPTAAVLDFDFGTIQQWWGGTWDIGKGVADLLVDEMITVGQVRMLERKKLEAVIAEQNLANSDRASVDAKEMAVLRKILGARVLIAGSITKFGGEESQVGGAAGAAAGRYLGLGSAKNTTAHVALTMRAVDSSTSEVLASVTSEGKSSRKGILLGARTGGNMAGFEMGSKDFRETILGEATQKAVKDAAAKLSAQIVNSTK